MSTAIALDELERIETGVSELNNEHPFLFVIKNKKQYTKALDTLEFVMTQKKINEPLMLILSNSISQYEDKLESVKSLELSASNMPTGVAAIRVLMNEYNLTMSDFPEIGKKSHVSLILSGGRKLTLDAVKALSERFKVSATLFMN